MSTLPNDYQDLQRFVAKWALPTEDERAAQRRRSSSAELQEFYDAVLARLPGILKAADEFPIGKTEGPTQALFYLAMSLAEVAPHVEFYRLNPNVPHAFQEDRMFGTRSAIPD